MPHASAAPPDEESSTRSALLRAAEQLFAERGIHAVSNRLISEAAGQGNNAAVNYHFGSKEELLRALVRAHTREIDAVRTSLVATLTEPTTLRDWAECAVRSVTTHISSKGVPSWYARFLAQVVADPALHGIDTEANEQSASLERLRQGMEQHLSGLPDDVRRLRASMARHMIIQNCVDTERALAAGRLADSPTVWDEVAEATTDAIVGMWSAPSGRTTAADSVPEHVRIDLSRARAQAEALSAALVDLEHSLAERPWA